MKNKLLKSAMVTLAGMLLLTGSAFAEGSKDLVENSAYRPYLEWSNTEDTIGIPRQNTLKVYVNAGEKIHFGSSVINSTAGTEIIVRKPNGEEYQDGGFRVTAEQGLISTKAQESAGPSFAENDGGYPAFVIESDQTGLWEFEFMSPNPNSTNNPKATKTSSENILTQNGNLSGAHKAVAAWDVTVVNAEGEIVDGRMFESYVALNTGQITGTHPDNVVSSVVYVLTKDGYEYQVDLNGIDPYGFLFYSNNRGFIDASSNATLYKTVMGGPLSKPSSGNFVDTKGGVIPQLPNVADTATNITHNIFFNSPSKDLPASIPTEPVAPAEAGNFRFIGTGENETNAVSGGVFQLTVDKPTTYQIFIDTDGDGIYTDGSDVIISDVAPAGDNSIYWDGTDASGNHLAPGTYTASLTTKGGEYHFPLLDAENNANGIKIKLVNATKGEDFNPNLIYYDNSPYVTANGTYVNTNSSNANAVNPVSALDGIDSSNGALKYKDSYGDIKAFDVWTYFPGNEYSVPFTITDDQKEMCVLSGFVFFDADESGEYTQDEEPLEGVMLEITSSDGSVTTAVSNASGKYSVTIPKGDYTVKALGKKGYKLTTDNELQAGTADSKVVYLENIGYTISNVKESTPQTKDYIIDLTKNTESGIIEATDSENSKLTFAITSQPSHGIVTVNPETGAWEYTQDSAVLVRDTFQVTVTNEFGNTAVSTVTLVPQRTPVTLDNDYAYIYGYTDDWMAPEYPIKRGEASALMHRLLKQNDLLNGYKRPSKASYSDLDTSNWDFTAIEFMTYIGVYDPEALGHTISSWEYITRGEAAKIIAISLGLEDYENVCDFSDLTEAHIYYPYINSLVAAGYMVGDGDANTIRPDDQISRAEFVAIYNRIINRDSAYDYTTDIDGNPVENNFTDMTGDEWYYADMLRATNSFTDYLVDPSKRQDRNALDEYTAPAVNTEADAEGTTDSESTAE